MQNKKTFLIKSEKTLAQKCDFIKNRTFVIANQIDSNIKDKSFGFILIALVVSNYHCVFLLLNRYTSVQTNVNNNKTKKRNNTITH